MTNIRGSIDALEGVYLSGWAYDADASDRSCQITIEDSSGTLIAQGRASRRRPDLAALGIGRTDFAFRLLLPPLTSSAQYIVRADEIPLGGPLHVGPGLFDGDAIFQDGIVSGWVTERITGFTPPVITVTDQDDRLIARVRAKFDSADQDLNYRPARFRVEVPNWAFNDRSLYVSVFANDVVFARCESMLRLIGYIDLITLDRCAGWLYSPDAPRRKLMIEVHQGNKLVGLGPCHIPRADITPVHPQAYKAGFDFALKLEQKNNFSHNLSFRLKKANYELFGGPLVAATRPALVAFSREISKMTLASAEMSAPARAMLQMAMRETLSRARSTNNLELIPISNFSHEKSEVRLTIIIPVYRGIDETRECIQSVLNTRRERSDRVIIVADRPPEAEMVPLLGYFASKPNVTLLINDENLGFIRSVNRALRFCLTGDVLLLNSDTVIFPGGLDEMMNVLHSRTTIGTVTALSNNATIFSYPHPSRRGLPLDDVSWAALAEVALERNRSLAIDVPTGHGFCLLIRARLLRQVGELDEGFGRGYGEENDFCQRAADLGYQHVSACGVLVEHRESVSFTSDKQALLEANLNILESRYPEYTPTIMAFEATDPLRVARRALDTYRLEKLGGEFLVVIEGWFGGGSRKAAEESTAEILKKGQSSISVRCLQEGGVEVLILRPWIRARFDLGEGDELVKLLKAAKPFGVIVHQLLGYDLTVIQALSMWLKDVPSIAFLHDFYAICPRVTLIDGTGRFCNTQCDDVCRRCLGLAGHHPHSRLSDTPIDLHRSIFKDLLCNTSAVIAPSSDTAFWIEKVLPVTIKVIPHSGSDLPKVSSARGDNRWNFTLFGAIGPHKGSDHLLHIARLSLLRYPNMSFTVIGFTDRDDELLEIGNVTISGPYQASQLSEMVAATDGRAALFLHEWPETFSYTLTEAARYGFVPIVPDIGAPAARVRSANFGIIYEFPIDAQHVVEVLASFARGETDLGEGDISNLIPTFDPANSLRRLLFESH